ncbi:hypothetical protein [Paraflavitalea sp. CAU 1676]|uniref:hypothetical protein n=1 Tax=Paraflavitalea sp. CAU 1676 TaxID=3032598 RepID=UPI0023DC2639|nr:hypothetical protein [Paraflavitalea sp. CAU 1676]MDF2188699.1 hypothetical protein [Paraflavitalea sp. CAU 1676]
MMNNNVIIKVMFFAFNPEVIFKQHEPALVAWGITDHVYVSCIDNYEKVYQEFKPDILCYHAGTIPIHRYADDFDCKLLAVSEHFVKEEFLTAKENSNKSQNNGLHIMGYVLNQQYSLLPAIMMIYFGKGVIFLEDELHWSID